jgi:phosphoserine phosphatase
LPLKSTWAAYTSPLSRSHEAALDIAQQHNLEVHKLAGLSDLCYGDWEGLPLGEVKVKYAVLYRQWEASPHTVRFPGGETLEELRSCALAAVAAVVQKHPGQVVLLSGHRAVNKVLIAAFIGLDNSHFWRIGQDTTAVNRVHWVGDTWHIMAINDTCHLRGMQRGENVDF